MDTHDGQHETRRLYRRNGTDTLYFSFTEPSCAISSCGGRRTRTQDRSSSGSARLARPHLISATSFGKQEVRPGLVVSD